MIPEHRKFICGNSGAVDASIGSVDVMAEIGWRSHLIALHFAI